MSDIEKARERIENILRKPVRRPGAKAIRTKDGSIAVSSISIGLSDTPPAKLLYHYEDPELMKDKITPENTKFCRYHQIEHFVSEFYPDKNSKDGLRTYCKSAELDMERKRIAGKKIQDRNCLLLDFNKVPNGLDMLASITKNAEENLRDPDKEIIFLLKGILKPQKPVTSPNQEQV